MTALARGSSALVPAHKKKSDVNVVEFASEEVAADVRVLRIDRRNRASTYGVRLAALNFDVSGHLIGALPGGELVDLGSLAVARGSIGGAHLRVSAPRTTQYEAIYLEIRSANLLLRVEAPRPPARSATRASLAQALVPALAASVLCGALALFAFAPQVLMSAPTHVVAGTTVHVPYATRGYGAREFSVRFDDGSPIKSGTLAQASGEIQLVLPPSSAHRRVVIELRQRATLGTRAGTASFLVDPAPALAAVVLAPARVLSLSARRDQNGDAETILISYLALADRGTVALVAPSARVVASAPFVHVGTSRLTVPPQYRTSPLVARLIVNRGTSNSFASVEVPANAATLAVAPIASDDTMAAEAVTPLDRSPARGAIQGIIGLEGRAIAGRPLRVRIMAQLTSVHAELQDARGASITEADVTPGATRFKLPLPPATSAQTYYLMLRYTRNKSEETVVRTIVAAAR